MTNLAPPTINRKLELLFASHQAVRAFLTAHTLANPGEITEKAHTFFVESLTKLEMNLPVFIDSVEIHKVTPAIRLMYNRQCVDQSHNTGDIVSDWSSESETMSLEVTPVIVSVK